MEEIEVRKREREELHILQEDKFEIEEVIRIFADDSREVIYVESSDGVFQGIISYGDCLKHLDEGRELINRNPTTLTVDTQEQMVDIFVRKEAIRNIAILDENSRILYEFARTWLLGRHYEQNMKQEKIYCGLLEKCGIKNIFFVECEVWGKRFKKYTSLAEMGINIILTDSYAGINADDSMIVDGNYIRSLVKKKEGYCVTHSEYLHDFLVHFFDLPWSNRLFKHMEWFADRVALTYNRIAVMDVNGISKQIIKELERNGKEVKILTKEDLMYDIFTKKYVLQKECDAEVIITCTFDYMRQKIVYGGEEVYNLNFILMGFRDRNNFAGECDVVNNILPQLVKKGVKVAVFHMKFENNKCRLAIKSILKYNLVKEYKKIFGMEDGFWNIGGDYKNGYFEFTSSNSPYYTLLEDGTRKTVGNYGESDHSMFFFGKCNSFGWGVKDEDTEASYLQAMVSNRYNVYNYSNAASQIPWKMRRADYKNGDIVLLACEDRETYERAGYSVYEISTDFFNDMKLEEVAWWNFMHANKKVTKRFAEIIYDYLVKNNYFNGEEDAD